MLQAERNETLAAIGEDIFAVAVDQPFRFPAAFTFVLRAFSTLEGLGKGCACIVTMDHTAAA